MTPKIFVFKLKYFTFLNEQFFMCFDFVIFIKKLRPMNYRVNKTYILSLESFKNYVLTFQNVHFTANKHPPDQVNSGRYKPNSYFQNSPLPPQGFQTYKSKKINLPKLISDFEILFCCFIIISPASMFLP